MSSKTPPLYWLSSISPPSGVLRVKPGAAWGVTSLNIGPPVWVLPVERRTLLNTGMPTNTPIAKFCHGAIAEAAFSCCYYRPFLTRFPI